METTTQTARIIGISSSFCDIEVADNCHHCSAQQGCGSAVLKQLIGKKNIRLPNTLNAQNGNQVLISMDKKKLTSLMLTTYLTPLATFFLGAIIGDIFFAESGAILGGFFGLFVGIMGLKHKKYATHYQPKITKVLE